MIEIKDNLQLPEILSEDFFQKSLQNGLQIDEIQIDKIKISSASSVGENYTGAIYRAEIEYRQGNGNSEQISLIVKTMVLSEIKIEFEEFEVFKKEVTMYTEIMPRIEKFFNPPKIFVPKFFYSLNQLPYQIIVVQDLKPLGYFLQDRIEKLNEAHSRILLQKLGRYHAGTIVLSKQEPKVVELFNKSFYDVKYVDTKSFQSIFVKSIGQFIDVVSSWDGFEEIAKKLRNVEKNFHQRIADCFEPKPNEIRVLNHSDLWTNNIMFKYENGKVCDVRFIDFQVSMNGSLGYDLNYFLNTSVQLDVLETKRDELVKFYYDSFREGLEELNYPNIPSLEAVLNEVKGKEFFGFIIGFGIAPIILLDRENSADSTFETVIDSDALSKKRGFVYSSPSYQDYMRYSLKRFDKLGIFD